MNIRNVTLYAASVAIVAVLFSVLNLSATTVGTIWAISFWALFGIDFYVSQVVHDGADEVAAYANRGPAGTSLIDRFFGYLFAAPFIVPARVYQLATR